MALGIGPTNPVPSVTLGWDLETNFPSLQYRLYWGPSSGFYTNVIQTTGSVVAVTPLTRGATYYFAVTAIATNALESFPSAEVIYISPLPPPAPTNLVIKTSQ